MIIISDTTRTITIQIELSSSVLAYTNTSWTHSSEDKKISDHSLEANISFPRIIQTKMVFIIKQETIKFEPFSDLRLYLYAQNIM